MLWRVLQSNNGLPKDAIVCFANTGKEDEETLKFVQRCSDEWNVPIHWVEYQKAKPGFKLVTFETASKQGEPFAELITSKNYLPNPIARFCTQELKVNAINKYLASLGLECETMIGVRADEPRRVGKLRERGLLVPLVDAGVTQQTVQTFWKVQPFDLGLTFRDGLTVSGNCDLCFLKGPNHIMALIQDKPDRAIWWAEQESKINARFRSDRPSYQQMLTFSKEQQNLFDPNEETIACFCGD